VADLEQWRGAIPAEGEELVAAAPLVGEWQGPALRGWPAVLAGALSGVIGGFMATLVFEFVPGGAIWFVVPLLYLALAVAALLWRRWWRRRHPGPDGMAAVVNWSRGRGPVLLVTATRVLQTGISSGTGRAAPQGLARDIPGLVAIEADGDLLVLSFEDGSTARLRQRWPTPGAAARVAELAAPVLRARQAGDPAAAALR
jgi:hypothetical protein